MAKSTFSTPTRAQRSRKVNARSGTALNRERRINRRGNENSDVLISAVISSYLLTHLHHVLQRAEYGAVQDGRLSQAANFAQLRKLLCMDARSMKDASAAGLQDGELDDSDDSSIESKVA